MKEYIALENYYMEIKDTENDAITKVYYKDGIGKLIMPNGIYTWANGTEAYLVDDENKQIQSAEMDSSLLISNEYVGSMLPGYSKSALQKFVLAGDINTSVKLKNYDGIKYYMITANEEPKKTTIWIQKDSLLLSQLNIELGDIQISYYYDITFDKVTNEDVKKPNIEEYTLVDVDVKQE